MTTGGAVSVVGNALSDRPPGEWIAGFSTLHNSGTNVFLFFAVTNTGQIVRGTPSGDWGSTPRNIFADTGRAPSEILGMDGSTNSLVILTASGDVFEIVEWPVFDAAPAVYRGNIGDIPTAVLQSTWGKLKAGYRK